MGAGKGRAPKLLLNQGPSETCYATGSASFQISDDRQISWHFLISAYTDVFPIGSCSTHLLFTFIWHSFIFAVIILSSSLSLLAFLDLWRHFWSHWLTLGTDLVAVLWCFDWLGISAERTVLTLWVKIFVISGTGSPKLFWERGGVKWLLVYIMIVITPFMWDSVRKNEWI